MDAKIGEIVMPGQVVNNVISHKSYTLMGPGLGRHDDAKRLVVTRGGVLTHKPKNVYWVEAHQKRYIPKKGDTVVGVVVKKGGDVIKVDIGGSEMASLSVYAFEGATKKQKPDLQVGDVVFAKVLAAHREMEPELVCIDKYYKAANLGPLSNDGFLITVSPTLTHKLLQVDCPLLQALGKKYVFELAVGMNGKIWINSRSCGDTLKLVKAFQAAQFMSDKDITELCRRF